MSPQYLPGDDHFTEASLATPSCSSVWAGRWPRYQPWDGSSNIVAATGYQALWVAATLHSGYFGPPRAFAGPFLLPSELPASSAAAVAEGATQPASRLCCWMYREHYGLDTTVLANFQLYDYSAAAANGNFRYACLLSRIRNATVSEGSQHQEAAQFGSCYMLLFANNGTTRTFFLLKVVADAITVLASSTLATSVQTYWGLGPRELELTTQTVGANVRLTCYSRRQSSIAPVTGAGATGEVLLFDYLDTSAPLTNPGRCGFGMSPVRLGAPDDGTVQLCQYVSITDNTVPVMPVLVVRDEWDRSTDGQLEIGYLTTLDGNGPGVQGHALNGRYSGDAFSNINNRFLTPFSNGIQATLTTQAWFAFDQRPATNPIYSHRKVTYTFANSSQSHRATIFVRGQWDEGISNVLKFKHGYSASVTFSTSSGGIWIFDVNYTSGIGATPATYNLARFSNASTVTYGLAVGVPKILEVECINVAGSPTIRVRSNGVQVSGWTLNTAGVAQGGAGDLTLSTTVGADPPGSVLSGTLEGFECHATAFDSVVLMDEWVDLGNVLPAIDYPTVALVVRLVAVQPTFQSPGNYATAALIVRIVAVQPTFQQPNAYATTALTISIVARQPVFVTVDFITTALRMFIQINQPVFGTVNAEPSYPAMQVAGSAAESFVVALNGPQAAQVN